MDLPDRTWNLAIEQTTPTLMLLKLSGYWCIQCHLPNLNKVSAAIAQHPETLQLQVNTEELVDYDSGLVIWLLKLEQLCHSHKISLDNQKLPDGVQRLISLSKEVPPRGYIHVPEDTTLLGRTGQATVHIWRRTWELIDLTGAAIIGSARFIMGRSIFMKRDILLLIQDNGPDAILIVSALAFMMGFTLALIAEVQLSKFGTEIYIADFEVVGVLRDIGAMMTGIIMAGRTCAAYAAEIGSMKTDGEFDSLHALGISGVDFLVMPRIIATVLMMPLLLIYADVIANFGGLLFCTLFLDITYLEYITQARNAFEITDFFIGIGKGFLFGYLIAIAGCLRGLQCGRTAAAVGNAAMSAVVLGLVLVMGCNTLIDFILYALRI